jgi:hypothetical protein
MSSAEVRPLRRSDREQLRPCRHSRCARGGGLVIDLDPLADARATGIVRRPPLAAILRPWPRPGRHRAAGAR